MSIPTSAIVDANGKKVVYVQNGNAFQSAEVTLGRTTGDLVEVKTGLFAGDLVVTQRGTQLYAQSLRGGGEQPEADGDRHDEAPAKKSDTSVIPPWLLPVGIGGGAILAGGSFWVLRKRLRSAPEDNLDDDELRDENYVAPDNLDRTLPVAEPSLAELERNHHPLVPALTGKEKDRKEAES